MGNMSDGLILNIQSLKWVCFVRLELALSRPSVCCRFELCFFLHLEREQRRLLGHSGDGHLGCQHNGLTRVSVFMNQVHTRLILQRAVSGDTLGVPCFDFLSQLIISWGLDGSEMKNLLYWAPPARSRIIFFISRVAKYFFILRHIKIKKTWMEGGHVATVTSSQQLQWAVASLARLSVQWMWQTDVATEE